MQRIDVQLIDVHLPKRHFSKLNEIKLDNATVPDWQTVRQINFAQSKIITILFFLRGLGTPTITLDNAVKSMFILLDKNDDEIVLGLLAQPWKPRGNVLHTSPDSFARFNEPNYIKAAWNFRFDRRPDGLYVTTETRVLCTSGGALRKFKLYWMAIGFFSGVIRNEMLKLIKQQLPHSARPTAEHPEL